MNLGKLLVAGKSIINGRAEISYRANRHVYLPKFGLVQNPFKSSSETEEPARPVAETIATPIHKAVSPVAAKTQKLPTLAPKLVRVTSWTSKLNPISILRGPAPAAQSIQAPVQSELSLDSVKVVQNDLSDADVEVVPIKSRTASEPVVPVLPPPTRPWEFLAERMFHATVD
jgi:hypothetical protein